jgi:hypothetical protein
MAILMLLWLSMTAMLAVVATRAGGPVVANDYRVFSGIFASDVRNTKKMATSRISL